MNVLFLFCEYGEAVWGCQPGAEAGNRKKRKIEHYFCLLIKKLLWDKRPHNALFIKPHRSPAHLLTGFR